MSVMVMMIKVIMWWIKAIILMRTYFFVNCFGLPLYLLKPFTRTWHVHRLLFLLILSVLFAIRHLKLCDECEMWNPSWKFCFVLSFLFLVTAFFWATSPSFFLHQKKFVHLFATFIVTLCHYILLLVPTFRFVSPLNLWQRTPHYPKVKQSSF